MPIPRIALFALLVAIARVGASLELDCADLEDGCQGWAAAGECDNNPTFMRVSCRKSCKVCDAELEQLKAKVLAEGETVALTMSFTLKGPSGAPFSAHALLKHGQDPAAAAVMFAEHYDIRGANSVVQVAEELARQSAAATPPYVPPPELRLRTAGAHKRKADEHRKHGEYDDEAVHLMRAILRPGLEETVASSLKRLFEGAMGKLPAQRKTEAAEAAAAAAAEARRVEEAAALIQARQRAELIEADWQAFLRQASSGGMEGAASASASADGTHADAPTPIVTLPLTLSRENGGSATVELSLQPGQEASHAVYSFCGAQGLHSVDHLVQISAMLDSKLAEVGVDVVAAAERWQLDASGAVVPATLGALQRLVQDRASPTAADHLERGLARQREGAYAEAGIHFTRALRRHAADGANGLSEEQLVNARQLVVAMMRLERAHAAVTEAMQSEQWEQVRGCCRGTRRGRYLPPMSRNEP